jgi:hypothetical protein
MSLVNEMLCVLRPIEPRIFYLLKMSHCKNIIPTFFVFGSPTKLSGELWEVAKPEQPPTFKYEISAPIMN